ncbi:MAG: phage holin family protein, partial [Anaerolineae bacterium]|nr:phage holin family protein [Anaerolineae bacterium]
MSDHSENARPVWLIPTICFLVGLLIGWWMIGWWLWPVKWTNALPVDLRAEERDQYLAMVAESYAATRNADLARERLKSWPADELAQHLANLQM